jgi:hypothetical protein
MKFFLFVTNFYIEQFSIYMPASFIIIALRAGARMLSGRDLTHRNAPEASQ